MPLHLTRHIRPLTVRFSEPGLPDFSLRLSSFTDIHASSSTSHAHPVLFDVVIEQPVDHGDPRGKRKASQPSITEPANNDVEDKAKALLERCSQETVRDLRGKVRAGRPKLQHRRLRLVHSGRILRDGTRLVSYFDSLDSHRKAYLRSLTSLAFDNNEDDDDGRQRSNATAPTTELVALRDLIPDWEGTECGDLKGKAKAKAYDDQERLGELHVSVTARIKERIYLQCSVGDLMDAEEEERENGTTTATIDTARPRPSFVLLPDSDDDGEDHATTAAPQAAQGFDRLLSTGLSPEEVATIRLQFHRSSGLSSALSGDILRQAEEEEHARALEDAWFDSFSQGNLEGSVEASGSGSFQTVLEGIMLGFFLPILPLFLFREGAWPSAFPAETAAGRLAGAGAPGTAGADEEEEEELRTNDHARNVTFSKGMQFAIIGGLFANLIMGGFRMLW